MVLNISHERHSDFCLTKQHNCTVLDYSPRRWSSCVSFRYHRPMFIKFETFALVLHYLVCVFFVSINNFEPSATMDSMQIAHQSRLIKLTGQSNDLLCMCVRVCVIAIQLTWLPHWHICFWLCIEYNADLVRMMMNISIKCSNDLDVGNLCPLPHYFTARFLIVCVSFGICLLHCW